MNTIQENFPCGEHGQHGDVGYGDKTTPRLGTHAVIFGATQTCQVNSVAHSRVPGPHWEMTICDVLCIVRLREVTNGIDSGNG